MRWKIETYADTDGHPSFRIFAGAAGQDLVCEVYSRELADAIAGLPEVSAVATVESVIAVMRSEIRSRIYRALALEPEAAARSAAIAMTRPPVGAGEGGEGGTDAT